MGDEDEALQSALLQSHSEQKQDSNNANNSNNNNGNDLVSSILGAMGANNNNSGMNESDITTLTNLGYSRSQAQNALTVCGGNVEMAASFLFSNSGSGGFGF